MVQDSYLLIKGKRFLSLPETSGRAMGPIQPHIHWVPVFVPDGKEAGVWIWPFTSF